MSKDFQMPPSPASEAECLGEMRTLLAAIRREAANRGHDDLADLADRTEKLADGLLKRRTN